MHDVAVQGKSYILYNSDIQRLRRANVQYTSPHNSLYNWVKQSVYPSHQTINRFAYNTGTIMNVLTGKHATSNTSHWKHV